MAQRLNSVTSQAKVLKVFLENNLLGAKKMTKKQSYFT